MNYCYWTNNERYFQNGIYLVDFSSNIAWNASLNVTQYADDTTVILDGSEKSLEQVVKTLDTFQQMCGLKINHQQTSAGVSCLDW